MSKIESEAQTIEQNRARGTSFAFETEWYTDSSVRDPAYNENQLRAFFNARQTGHGIWKWDHYFEIYDRHFSKFRGKPVHFLEIGVYSGGSLDMWRDYFGPQATIYGVDLQPACKVYETDGVKIFIGDQADRNFWCDFREKVPHLDIVVDDGGHEPEQQMVTLEELLPHLRPGGVFLCEDVHGSRHSFMDFIQGMTVALNDAARQTSNPNDDARRIVGPSTPFQAAVHSVCCYPYVTVVEKNLQPLGELIAPKKGTLWQPFLK